jgi:replication factor C subunit 3/5
VTPSKRKLDVNVVQSNYHIELTPSYVAEDEPACTPWKLTLAIRRHSDVGMYDRVVIQDILKEIAQTQQVDLNAKQKFKGEPAGDEIDVDVRANSLGSAQHPATLLPQS